MFEYIGRLRKGAAGQGEKHISKKNRLVDVAGETRKSIAYVSAADHYNKMEAGQGDIDD